jgi:hypothetical protein
MKKSIIVISIIALITLVVTSMSMRVKAHPGRTDGRGGHTNHSTGEYHYHHGYSAHQHYDMDGDGDIDCPYDFDDKTNHSSKSSQSSKKPSEPEPKKEDHPVLAGILAVGLYVFFMFVLPFLIQR